MVGEGEGGTGEGQKPNSRSPSAVNTSGATASRPNAGSTHSTSGSNMVTGRRRARASAAARRRRRASSLTRSRPAPTAPPSLSAAASRLINGRAAGSSPAAASSRALAKGTPASVLRSASTNTLRYGPPVHGTTSRTAASTESPAPSPSRRRSALSGRVRNVARVCSSRRRREPCQRRNDGQAITTRATAGWTRRANAATVAPQTGPPAVGQSDREGATGNGATGRARARHGTRITRHAADNETAATALTRRPPR